MKKTYIEPELEVVEFETEDIMAASGGGVSYSNNLDSWSSSWGSTSDW